MEDLGTVRRIFIHHTGIAEFFNETFFSLNVCIGNIADFVGMEAIPNINTRYLKGNHFVPTRALAKGMMEVGSMKLMNAYPTLWSIISAKVYTCIYFESRYEGIRNRRFQNW